MIAGVLWLPPSKEHACETIARALAGEMAPHRSWSETPAIVRRLYIGLAREVLG